MWCCSVVAFRVRASLPPSSATRNTVSLSAGRDGSGALCDHGGADGDNFTKLWALIAIQAVEKPLPGRQRRRRSEKGSQVELWLLAWTEPLLHAGPVAAGLQLLVSALLFYIDMLRCQGCGEHAHVNHCTEAVTLSDRWGALVRQVTAPEDDIPSLNRNADRANPPLFQEGLLAVVEDVPVLSASLAASAGHQRRMMLMAPRPA
mmetsp:Transcript_20204/g.55986  ORF Transcript_20204/g.55986 Transcript_20204/m.55986 type:complete len:204 (+) Transcript_20204:514-1125(+)|eukprot:CAMPEP_0117521002 /NCGR_PEP_ID=MMETSP0784-20121206/33460_1 /TAXON_ID=39447 /ORGANISM="" /LENGTH=203 /DNA_ID=CAMNT_0005317015 /DNA_START=486 /DNA_END=1097 /DNA_ORIENTATION=-